MDLDSAFRIILRFARVLYYFTDNSAVLSMAPTQSGGLASGGADGVVKVWDNDLTVKSFHSTPSKVCTLFMGLQ